MQKMEENTEVREIVDMVVPEKSPQEADRAAMIDLRPNGHVGTADHTGECPEQNILEVKN